MHDRAPAAFAAPPAAAQLLVRRLQRPRGHHAAGPPGGAAAAAVCVAAPPSERRRGNGGRGSRAKQRPGPPAAAGAGGRAGRRGGRGAAGGPAAAAAAAAAAGTRGGAAAAQRELLARAVADRRVEADAARRRPRGHDALPLAQLVVGARVDGVVRNLVRHGAYVDVGAVTDGLVHVRDMSVQFVYSPADCLRTGDTVRVWVKYVDPVRNILGLTLVPPAGRAGFNQRVPVKELAIGERVEGVVARVTNYGAYVDLGAERHGFVHVSALWGRRPRDTLENLRLGAKILVHVDEVDEVRSFIRLRARGRRVEVPLDKDGELGDIHEELRHFGNKDGGRSTTSATASQRTPTSSVTREFVLQRFGVDIDMGKNKDSDDAAVSFDDDEADDDDLEEEDDDEASDTEDDDEYELDILDDTSVMRFQPGRQRMSVLKDFGVTDVTDDDDADEDDTDDVDAHEGRHRRSRYEDDEDLIDEIWSEPSRTRSYGLDDLAK